MVFKVANNSEQSHFYVKHLRFRSMELNLHSRKLCFELSSSKIGCFFGFYSDKWQGGKEKELGVTFFFLRWDFYIGFRWGM